MANAWKYSDSVNEDRQERLYSARSFEDIAARIAKEMSILCYHLQGCDDDSKFARPIFCIRVPTELFDSFFNAPKGYRGSYFESPFQGLESNRYLFERLFALLSSWAARVPGYNARFAQDSLLALSAKAWLAEVTLELCESCSGEWSRPADEATEILNGRWETDKSQHAKWGRRAPQFSKIRLFGAFLSGCGQEFVPASKRDRHYHIHSVGWS